MPPKNIEVSLDRGNGDECMMCFEPVQQSELCLLMKINRVKIAPLLPATSKTERAHLHCAALLHRDLEDVLGKADKILSAKKR